MDYFHKNVLPESRSLSLPYGVIVSRSSKVSSAQNIFLPVARNPWASLISSINVLLPTARLCLENDLQAKEKNPEISLRYGTMKHCGSDLKTQTTGSGLTNDPKTQTIYVNKYCVSFVQII